MFTASDESFYFVFAFSTDIPIAVIRLARCQVYLPIVDQKGVYTLAMWTFILEIFSFHFCIPPGVFIFLSGQKTRFFLSKIVDHFTAYIYPYTPK